MRLNRLHLVVSLCMLAGCAAPPPPAMQEWRDTDGKHEALRKQTRYVAYSTKWRASTEAVYHKATDYIEKGVAANPTMPWAIVMDLDQTVMNNIGYHIEADKRGADYSMETWRAWVEAREATLVPGAYAFIAKANALGGKVVFVTNRRDYEVQATEDNLTKLGLIKGMDYVAILPREWSKGDEGDKQARFASVPKVLADLGYPNRNVVAHFGDVEGDRYLGKGCAVFFCVPQGGLYGTNCLN